MESEGDGDGVGDRQRRERKERRSYHDITPLLCHYISEWRSSSSMSRAVRGGQSGGRGGTWGVSVREWLRPGTYHVLVLMELQLLCGTAAQRDRSLLNALSRK